MSLPDQPRLLDLLFSTADFLEIFSNRRILQGMLDFEAALARAEAVHGIIPSKAAAAIESQCRAELFDVAAIAREAASAGNLAIPLVKALTASVATRNPEAARFVHFGATSQDAIDTGLILQLRDAFPARSLLWLTSINTPRWSAAPGCSRPCPLLSD
jgi:3-carboxy-cis,cis-muconate cycloisomerase